MDTLTVILFIGVWVFLYIIYQKLQTPSGSALGDTTQIGVQLAELKGQLKLIDEKRALDKKHEDELRKKDEEAQKQFIEGTGKTLKVNTDQITVMHKSIADFQRTIQGTKRRGQVGEQALKETLKAALQSNRVEKNLRVDGKTVEYAWKLSNGKYIPIDAKLPEVDNLVQEFDAAEEDSDRKKIGKQIVVKIEKEITNIKKYQNTSKTVDKCVLVIPDGVLEMFPELIDEGLSNNVVICGFETVYIHLFILMKEYELIAEKGDVGAYKKIVEQYQHLLKQIQDKTDSIDRGVKTISNANDEIKDSVKKGNHL
ncbi:MAG: DNA recombination protein RmuC [Nanoarchaeota archaeon]